MYLIKPSRQKKGAEKKPLGLDRRSLENRRKAYNLNYFLKSGKERRLWKERRKQLLELRKGWVRVSDWTSALIGSSFESERSNTPPTRQEKKAKRKSLGLDRRSLEDRRKAYNLNYFQKGGKEKRHWREQRKQLIELRKGWARVSDWTSALIGSIFESERSNTPPG